MHLKIILLIAMLLFPGAALGKTASVFIGPYRMLWEDNANVEERASAVAEALRRGAVSAGFDAKMSGACDDDACLKAALDSGFDEALFVETVASDAGYEFTIRRTGGRVNRLSSTGAFVAAVERLERESAKILDEKPAAVSKKPDGDKKKTPPTSKIPDASRGSDDTRTGLHSAFFFSGLGISVGLTGVFIALDVTLHKRYEKLAGGGQTLDYWQTSHNMQIANRVVFGFGVAAIIATVVFAPLTDFELRRGNTTLQVGAGAFEDGGFLTLQGRF